MTTRFDQLEPQERARIMRKRIRDYFDGCNTADVDAIAREFTSDGVHYFPPGLDGPWRGARTIGEKWRELVLKIGSAWSIERIIVDPEQYEGVIEWTHWKTALGGFLRGDEWYVFDQETGLIAEIRAFYASASDGRDAVELQDYDYAANGYHLEPPVERPHPDAA